jgi:hypothetical protein
LTTSPVSSHLSPPSMPSTTAAASRAAQPATIARKAARERVALPEVARYFKDLDT